MEFEVVDLGGIEGSRKGSFRVLYGLPRALRRSYDVRGENLDDAISCDVPDEAITAMREHALNEGDDDVADTDADCYSVWAVGDVIVVTHHLWN